MNENQDLQSPEIPVQENAQQQEPSIQEYMAFAFQEQRPPAGGQPELEPAPQVTPTGVPVEVPLTTTPTEPSETIVEPSAYLKEHFGYEDRETIKNILAEYNDLKSRATTASEYQYANEEAKKLAHAINSGDYKTVRAYVEAQELNIEGMTDEQILKQHIKMQNPMFSNKHVEEEYAELYSLNEEDIDEGKIERERLKMEQKKYNDIEKAKEYFAQYKTKAQLPDIKQKEPEVDPLFEQYKASTAKTAQLVESIIVPGIKSLKESDLGISFQVSDQNNHMNFGVNIEVDPSDFQDAVTNSVDLGSWIDNSFWDAESNFQPKKLARAILLEKNFDKYAQSIARQAVNAERKRLLDASTTTPSIQRDFTVPQDDKENNPIHQEWKRAMAV